MTTELGRCDHFKAPHTKEECTFKKSWLSTQLGICEYKLGGSDPHEENFLCRNWRAT